MIGEIAAAEYPRKNFTGVKMQTFVVKAITKTCSWVNGIDAHLDAPVVGPDIRRVSLSLSGWIASRSEYLDRVWLAWRGNRIADAKISPRPDVGRVHPGRCEIVGFQIDALPLLFGEGEPLKIIVSTKSGRTTALFEISLEFAPGRERAADVEGITFVPIVAMARSGTTYLSHVLHGHNGVLGHVQYPYEARFGNHLAQEWFARAQPWSYEPLGSRTPRGVDQNLVALREIFAECDRNPERARQLLNLAEDSARRCRDEIVQFYRMASTRGQGSIIVEKIGLGMELDLLSALFPRCKPIFLIRDPRDVLLSMRAFNEKRELYEFHEAHSKDLGALLFSMSANAFQLTHQFDSYAGDKLLVRYENLVRDPRATLRQIGDFIGIDASGLPESLFEQPAQSVHTTASSRTESIGRWNAELTPSEAALADWFFNPFLTRFGY